MIKDFIFSSLLLFVFHFACPAQVTIHLKSIPESTPDNAEIFFAGNINQWNPADENFELTKKPDGDYWIELPSGSGKVQFKFTRGSWETVEANDQGIDRQNRTFNYGNGDTLHLSIASWLDLDGSRTTPVSTANEQVMILDSSMYIPQLDRYRKIWIYLPQDYRTSDKSYRVLYMHDGQSTFDKSTSFAGEWRVDETLTELENQGYESAIVVAIDNGGEHRLDEYSSFINPQYGGGEGDAYLDFIVETLKPKIDSEFRTLTGPENTGIMGSSMGGLISHYAYFRHPEIFGRVAIFSPSYWFSSQYLSYSLNQGKSGAPRLYMLAGGKEGKLAQDTKEMYNSLVGIGFTSNELAVVIEPDGQHSEWFWAREFREAFQWIFNTEQITSLKNDVDSKIQIFPNPTKATLTIVGEGMMNFKILNIQGKLLENISIHNNGEIDIAPFPDNLLILEMELEGKRQLYRIVKE